MAPGSVMKDPSSGPIVRIEIHQAAGVSLPKRAKKPRQPSAKRSIGRVEASAMIITTKSGSVKFTPIR